jgi:ammonia channel protein AmtB
MLWGYPSSQLHPDAAVITPWGNTIGAVIMFGVLGFIPAYIAAGILKACNALRIPREIELVGLDLSEHAARYVEEEEVVAAELEEARRAGLLR